MERGNHPPAETTFMGKLSVSDYVRQYKREMPLEVVNYEPRLQTPMVAGRATVARNIYNTFILYQHDHDRNSGETYFRLPYLILDNEDWVQQARLPEVIFIQLERWNSYIAYNPDWQSSPILIVPDVAVKAASLEDTENSLDEWAKLCIQDGVQSAWIANWKQKQINIYTLDKRITFTPTQNNFISDIAGAPGFLWSVDSLMEGIA
jgi:Uma2 family endonuclease